MVSLTRRYQFSASHRLHNETLDAEQNARLYGKCNSPYGHGHNYIVEVTVRGPVDPATGMVMDLVTLDQIVEKEVLERLDHTYLNLDVKDFETRVPTAENLCIDIFDLLCAQVERNSGSAHLEKVRLEETSSNFFEYYGQSSNHSQAAREKK